VTVIRNLPSWYEFIPDEFADCILVLYYRGKWSFFTVSSQLLASLHMQGKCSEMDYHVAFTSDECFVHYCLRNDLYCVEWGVKLYSVHLCSSIQCYVAVLFECVTAVSWHNNMLLFSLCQDDWFYFYMHILHVTMSVLIFDRKIVNMTWDMC